MLQLAGRTVARAQLQGCCGRILQKSQRCYTNEAKPFDKILVANRGEIACRVMRTCREMGIKSVAIYSDADTQALHTRSADERVRVGPAPATESYLVMDAVLNAIDTTGAQAVHPGYGFLSENKEFANRLEEKGVVFIGPDTHAIHVMGDKLESKRTAIEAGVHTIPGYDGILKDADEAVKEAEKIGYPVMLKASAGGGGKGMRIARNEQECRDGFTLATEEAVMSVNDGRMLIEKYIDKPRHIEIQILGDKHGNVVYLNERECSIQRRNQKVIEEAPSTFLDPETRRAMGEQAVALSKAVKYSSAGTCEFLVDSQRNFYFLEMNTRLQVEHPITEMITGVDIVKEMINVASGRPLSVRQEDIGINGWAVECRVYAEDPVRFLPSIGYLSTYREPINAPGLENVRVDTGIVEGSTISMYYDPMISKLVTHGDTREDALATMAKALDHYCIKGVNHNIPVLRDIITQPCFISGDITTNFIAEVYPGGFKGRDLSGEERKELVAAACYMHITREVTAKQFTNHDRNGRHPSAWPIRGSAGSGHTRPRQADLEPEQWQLVVKCGGESVPVTCEWREDGVLEVRVKERGEVVTINTDWILGDAMMLADIDGKEVAVQYENRRGRRLYLRHYGNKYEVVVYDSQSAELSRHIPERDAEDQAHILLAPMPGVVKKIQCEEGDSVAEGTIIVTLEAMKMQNPLFAPMTGRIKKINVRENDSIGEDEVILEFYQESDEAVQ